MTGTKSAVGPPGSTATRCRSRWCSCCCRASGRSSRGAGDRGNARRNFAAADGRCGRCRRPRRARRGSAAVALGMFFFGAFVVATVGQEFTRGVRARRAMSGEARPGRARRAGAPQPPALRRLHRPCRDGGAVHRRRGVVGLPARARRADGARAEPVDGYEIDYMRATGRIVDARGPAGADRVRRGAAGVPGRQARRDAASRARLLPACDAPLGPIGRSSTASPRARSAWTPGSRGDVWSSMQPDLSSFAPTSRTATRSSSHAARKPASQDGALRPLRQALDGLVERYEAQTPAATFRFIVSPMVAWIWLGGMIVFLGGLIALWPRPATRRRRGGRATRRASRRSSAGGPECPRGLSGPRRT